MKNILVACEESQTVTKAFKDVWGGHEFNIFSCDLQEESGGHPEWHIQANVLPLLNGDCTFTTRDGTIHTINGKWDLLICHPVCTHLAVSGAPHFEKKRKDGRQREGIEFFCQFLNVNCDHVAIENPVNIISGDYIPKWFPDLAEKYNLPISPSQYIHPWMFGDNVCKKTGLWLKGLPNLIPDVKEQPYIEKKEWVNNKGQHKAQDLWWWETFKIKDPLERSKARSKTFRGIAYAMATQWGKYVGL